MTLAGKFGVCPAAWALTTDYTALRRRTEGAEEHRLVKPTIIQLPATLEPPPGVPHAPGPTIEISARDGSRMRISLQAGGGTEALDIMAAYHASPSAMTA
ncbi:hypothetical protein [Holophaga foetida]|uniref:hypothetical protein n=1 Tax=Holophaga foetida TaxID=35839 RepID=UPI000247429B|nr:hypothetical protein [Holophaga foetida]